MRARIAVLVPLLAACTIEEAEPVALPVLVEVLGPVESPASLRLAVIFRAGTSTLATADVAVPEERVVVLSLEHAPTTTLAIAAPIESVAIQNVIALRVIRPQLIAYEDRDGSGALELGGADRPIGLDYERTIAFIPALERSISILPPHFAQGYYEHTGGRYTRYIRVAAALNSFAPVIAQHHEPIQVRTGALHRLDAEIACFRTGVGFQATPLAVSVTASVGLGLDAEGLCGAELARCTAVDLEHVPVPPTTSTKTADLARAVACRRRGDLETYLVRDQTPLCRGCLCSFAFDTSAYFTRTSSAPAWWPCGDEVPFCASAAPLYELPDACVEPG